MPGLAAHPQPRAPCASPGGLRRALQLGSSAPKPRPSSPIAGSRTAGRRLHRTDRPPRRPDPRVSTCRITPPTLTDRHHRRPDQPTPRTPHHARGPPDRVDRATAAAEPPTRRIVKRRRWPSARRQITRATTADESRPCTLQAGEPPAFPGVVRGLDQPAAARDPQRRRRRYPVPGVAGHRPHLAVSPGGMRLGVFDPVGLDPLGDRRRPRTAGRLPGPGAGLPAPPGPLGHVEEPAEPRGRHARLDADHLEVLEGPRRPSADFFHTRSSTWASPSAALRSLPGPTGPAPPSSAPA